MKWTGPFRAKEVKIASCPFIYVLIINLVPFMFGTASLPFTTQQVVPLFASLSPILSCLAHQQTFKSLQTDQGQTGVLSFVCSLLCMSLTIHCSSFWFKRGKAQNKEASSLRQTFSLMTSMVRPALSFTFFSHRRFYEEEKHFHKPKSMGWFSTERHNNFAADYVVLVFTCMKRFRFSSLIFPRTSNVTVIIPCKWKDTLIIA